MRVLLVGNPASGSGRGVQRTRRVQRRMEELGATVTTLLTRRVGHARRALTPPPPDVDRVVACGGDGLVSECAAALAGRDLPLAIVPAGRGNDFAAALGMPSCLDAAAQAALAGRESRVDLGLANGRPFCTVAACGIDAEVSRRARTSLLPLPGAGVYVVELLRALRTFRGARLHVEADGRVIEADALALAVANTPTYGGGFRIAPGASLTDGLLDVCLVRAMGRLRALRLFPAVLRGTHERLCEVSTFRCESLTVTARPELPIEGDGEPLAATPVAYGCSRAGLLVVTARRS